MSKLIGAEWKDKFKAAIDIADPLAKTYLDELLVLRRQLRNFVAHGAFGKKGEAFHFHSDAGAVAVVVNALGSRQQFSLGQGLKFDDQGAVALIQKFILFMWSGERESARLYI